jgi:hypothetical protein
MGCPLPRVLGTLSDATLLKFSNINSQLVEMLMLAVATDDFADLTAWTETDADDKVNLSGGVVSMDGGNNWGAHGLRRALSVGVGYLEIKMSCASGALSGQFALGISNANALPNAAGSGIQWILGTATNIHQIYDSSSLVSNSTIWGNSTYHTYRLYVSKNISNNYRKIKVTIFGGSYTTETVLLELESCLVAVASTFYVFLQRYASSSGNLGLFKEFRWYSGYSTAAPYVEYIHDAGAGKVFDNLDFTAFTMPGTVPVTNLKCAYSFDDGSASYSSYLTLAGGVGSLQAIGKIIARHRYIRLRVQGNSDGPTQVYIDKPNSDTATDGIGDFSYGILGGHMIRRSANG